MPLGLVRYQQTGHFHFLTFSCYRRQPGLGTAGAREALEEALERARSRCAFVVLAYVVMPEHVHLLVTEPRWSVLAAAIQGLKIAVARRLGGSPFWQPRYYDFNVFTDRKRIEKMRYIHRNPVKRGLVEKPEDWEWSSYRHYLTGEKGRVEIGLW